MNKVIVIYGDLASGKSALADNLSLRLNIPCFKKDKIKEDLVDKYHFKNREENRALSIRAVNFLLEATRRFLTNGNDIIVEANFRENELLEISDICKEFNAKPYCFFLTGDIDVLYERFLKRLPTRHIAHTSVGLEESIDKFKGYILELRNVHSPFDDIKIDSTQLNEEEVAKVAIEALKN